MNRKRNAWIGTVAALALMILAGVPTAKAQISVVVGKNSKLTANASELKQLFSGAKSTWPTGEKAMIIDQTSESTGKGFYESFIGKPGSQIRSEWTKLVLSGQANAPKKCADDESVKRAVAENPRAVGFVATGSLDDSVKEIYRVIVMNRN